MLLYFASLWANSLAGALVRFTFALCCLMVFSLVDVAKVCYVLLYFVVFCASSLFVVLYRCMFALYVLLVFILIDVA